VVQKIKKRSHLDPSLEKKEGYDYEG